MVKKVFALALGLLLFFGAMAQSPKTAAIASSDVRYWVGSGSNQAVVLITWEELDSYGDEYYVGAVWGVRFNGTILCNSLMDTLTTYDANLSISMNSGRSFINDMTYNNTETGLELNGSGMGWWMYTVNGVMASAINSQSISDGDFVEWSDMGQFAADTIIFLENPNASDTAVEDATIAAEDILYWVGYGENQVVMAINWADTALAWGYRFSTDSVLVGDMVDEIAVADPRFSYEGSPAYISDFYYADSMMSDTLRLTPHDPVDYSIYFNMAVNHVASMLGAGAHKVVDGDFVKFADTYVAVKVDSTWVPDWGGYWDYTYAWPMTIHPVSVPDTTGHTPEPQPEHGPFCGAVGTEGCNAIAADSNAIVAWATGVTLTRGPQNITNPEGPLASFGGDTNAIGMATRNNTMDAVSLGDGGSALVTFEHPIRNGEGPDFAVYENSFSDNSLELAFVEVSTDGERFVRFPATCLTQTETQLPNSGQTDPTNLNNLAGKFRIGYGTPFDLEELRDSTGINIDSIVYVRVVDVVGNIDPQYGSYDAFGHIVNDPWPTPFNTSGFDLTGVAVLNELAPVQGIDEAESTTQMGVYPNPTTDHLFVELVNPTKAFLLDITGRCMAVYELHEGRNTLDLADLPTGVYMLRCEGLVSKIVKK